MLRRRATFFLILGFGVAPSIGERAPFGEEDLGDLFERSGELVDTSTGAQEVAAFAVDVSAGLHAARASVDGLAEKDSANLSRQQVPSLPTWPVETMDANATAARSSSSGNLTGSLKVARVQAHEALAIEATALAEREERSVQHQREATDQHRRAAAVLAEQRERSDQHQQEATALAEQRERSDEQKHQKHSDQHEQHGSRAAGNSTSGRKDEPTQAPAQKFAEEKAHKEEETSLQPSLGTMTKAFTDPRGFLMELPGMKNFSAGIKAAIELGPNKGKCLAAGEFAGYGCGDSKDLPKMCSCAGLFQMCYLPDDPKRTVDKMSKGQTQEAFEEAKTLLFGKCYQSWLLISLAVVVSLIGMFFASMYLKRLFRSSSS